MPGEITRIEDKRQRTIAYCKRKRIIIKKCIEIALKCDQDVYLCMFDKNTGRMIELNTSDTFEPKTITELKSKKKEAGIPGGVAIHEKYSQKDYQTFLKNSTIKNNQCKTQNTLDDGNSSDNSIPKKVRKSSNIRIKKSYDKPKISQGDKVDKRSAIKKQS